MHRFFELKIMYLFVNKVDRYSLSLFDPTDDRDFATFEFNMDFRNIYNIGNVRFHLVLLLH